MCRDVSAMATDYMEGTLGWRRRLAIRLHLAVCDGCRAFMQQMRRTVRLIGSLPATPPPPETEARLLATLPDRPSPGA
jgi:anti-sigma factor ChrR (cupin superfamily)